MSAGFVHTDADGSRLRHEFVQTPASGSMCSACGKPKNDHQRTEEPLRLERTDIAQQDFDRRVR